MKWIRLKDRWPDPAIDGSRLIVDRMLQDKSVVEIMNIKMFKHLDKNSTFWMPAPEQVKRK